MNLPDFLTQDADGDILLTGHRIGLYHVLHYYNEGFSPEMLVGQYPTLPLVFVYKLLAFYLENRDEVDRYLASCKKTLATQRANNPRRLDLALLRGRLDGQHEETA